jgi:hypothetical protein
MARRAFASAYVTSEQRPIAAVHSMSAKLLETQRSRWLLLQEIAKPATTQQTLHCTVCLCMLCLTDKDLQTRYTRHDICAVKFRARYPLHVTRSHRIMLHPC